MDNTIIGYVAASTSIIALISQFVHTIHTKTTVGLSLYRTILDSLSLFLWVTYAAQATDTPLMIATTFELLTSIGVCILILRHRNNTFIKVLNYTPPQTPPDDPKSVIIEIKPERRNSI